MKNQKITFSKGLGTLIMLGLFGLALGSSVISLHRANAQTVLVSVAITASPGTICSGQSARLTWSSTDATSISINQGIGSVNPYGEMYVSPSQSTTYTITGTNSTGGYGTASATVNVTGSCGPTPTPTNPSVSLTADNYNLAYNGSTTLRWNSQNATSCSASGGTNGWSGNRITSGSFNTGNLTGSVTYNIICSNSVGSASDSVTVSVGSQQQPLLVSVAITASPGTIDNGQSSVLSWSSTNATSINISPNIGSVNPYGTRTVSPAATTTYTITGTNTSGGYATASATVYVRDVQQNPSVTLSADSTNLSYGESTTLRWSSQNATSCSASGAWSGSKGLSGNQSTGALTSSRTYIITCNGVSGTTPATDSVTVNVGNQQVPSVDLTANPTSIQSGQNSTLSWISNNTTSCSAFWTGSTATSGTGVVVPTSTTTYSITCYGTNGQQANDTVTVSVNQLQNPTVSLTADDTDIDFNDDTTLRWTSANATSCTASGGTNGWSGSKNLSGTFNTGNLTSDRTYSITCVNSAGQQAFDSVTVRVDDEEEDEDDPTVNLRADDSTVNYNGNTILRWSSTDADSCRASGGTNGWSGSRSRSGTFNTGNLISDVTYSITCTNDSGSDSDSVTVRVNNQTCQDPNATNYRGSLPCTYNVVNQLPAVVIYADSTNIAYNAATTIRWSTVNATSCFASGGSIGWAGTKSIGPGSFYTGSLTGSRTYTITCNNNVGSDTDSVTVTVRGQVLGTTITRPAPTSLVLITSSVDRNQPIIPTLDNTNPCPGDEINYTVTYQNIGTGAVTNLSLRIDLPYEVDYMFSTPNNPVRSGNTLMFNLGTLRANGEGTVTVRVRVRDNIPAGAILNFPATLSYVDPSGFPQSVTANVSARVCSGPVVIPTVVDVEPDVLLRANVFGAGFLPEDLFGWLLLIILILILLLLARYLFSPNQAYPFSRQTTTTYDQPYPPPLATKKTTTTTVQQ